MPGSSDPNLDFYNSLPIRGIAPQPESQPQQDLSNIVPRAVLEIVDENKLLRDALTQAREALEQVKEWINHRGNHNLIGIAVVVDAALLAAQPTGAVTE